MTERLRMPAGGWQAAILIVAALLGVLAAVNPVVAVVGALGLGFVALVIADLTIGLCIFVVVSFWEVSSPTFNLTKLIGLLLFLSWIAVIATRHRSEKTFFAAHPYASYLLLVFLAWALLSALWAKDDGIAAFATTRYALNFALFPIVFTAVRTERDAIWIAAAFVLGATMSAAYGLTVHAPAGDLERLSGSVGEANELASVLIAALVMAIGLTIIAKRSPLSRLAALGGAAFCLAGILLSLSRGGLLGLGVVLLTAIFVAGRRRGLAAFVVLAVAISAVTYYAAFAAPQARERVTTLERGTGRLDLWKIGWRMAGDKPITGVGADNFKVTSRDYLLQAGPIQRSDFVLTSPKQTHNVYLETLAELGIVGLMLLLGIMTFALSCAARAGRRFRALGSTRLEVLSWCVLLAGLGILAADFFQSTVYSKQLWLLLALGPALLAMATRTTRET